MTEPFRIYFAGDLFDHKDLIGNSILQSHIEKISEGRYLCRLPQDLGEDIDPQSIRNRNYKEIFESDLALFNFDGNELDSGTVAEFIFAKFLDVPSVIFRSDFRSSGDQGSSGDDWNLMLSFFPRTRSFQYNSMAWYKESKAAHQTDEAVIQEIYTKLATSLIQTLDEVRQEPPLMGSHNIDPELIYQWAALVPGSDFTPQVSDKTYLKNLVLQKKQKGVL
ncbi:MAG: hypothetical protein HN580_15590 [Deltaproteobacteria bacterium]|jgi:nucleoside 2-deoxyribosyltransferase|nr:hypothetical protein [Deltaproteobacteria bacterium]MBT4640488.1 hypothetical protein [Deltaproteobacteria bacterium]MBT6503455.1 hypothetical protein [Deltaproteobacteria bacterium]MBT7155912.1 hypothetical protein [Deltaproteobacteria bacterium]MBT7713728.1 hypothetical protein [Deltaproteobacteria bacterium]